MGTPTAHAYENQNQLFFRDKIAWENAIRQYSGNDPLEMWYNYICWYDYNNQIDPENKFREALEKCLTLFEHVECYKQDLRLVKLWIKYIDLQPNPLNLYQLLYQRGIGIRCACFYVGWSHYYDSANAFKQAESVFNLGFQAQAEPYCDLQEAHNKFRMSVSQRMLYNDSSSKKREQNHLIEQRHQITTLQQQNSNSNQSPQYQNEASAQLPQNNINDTNYLQHQSQVNNNAGQQPIQYNAQNNVQTTVQIQNSDTYNNSQQFYNSTQNYESMPSTQSNFQGITKNTLQLANSIENFNNNIQQSITAETIQNNKRTVQPDPFVLENLKVPPNFAYFSYNNYETWKPLLYLEEPYDENRKCMYMKHLVYPSEELEYSPEELRSQTWKKRVSIQTQEIIEIIEDEENEAPILNESHNTNISNNNNNNINNNNNSNINNNYNNNAESITQNELQTNNIVQSTNENSFFVGDLEEQIEASTIRYASDANGETKNKVIKIKFRKDNSFNDSIGNTAKEPKLEISTPKTKKRKLLNSEESEFAKSFQGDNSRSKKIKMRNIHNESNNSTKLNIKINNDKINPKFNNSVQQYNENANSEFNTSQNDDTFDNMNCSTPFKKVNGVPQSSLRRNTTNSFHQNEDSMCFEQNSFFASEYDDELVKTRLDKALNTIDLHLKKPAIDPFNSELCKAFLTKLDIPSRKENDIYKLINNPIPKLGNTKMIAVADVNYNIEKEVGKGAYGNVYKALNLNTNETVAIKYQRPPNMWELYICMEVSKRIKKLVTVSGFMDISSAAIAPNASIFVTEFSSFGSLLDINNKVRQATKKVMHESLVIHFSIQMLQIIQYLHSCKIIHADIKPDNFLLMKVPNTNSNIPSLRLIDFGCAIDMTLFPEGTQFKKIIQTEGFTCTEMQEGREWSYQTDLFCAAGTIHVLLFGEYMQINKKFDLWDIKQKIPRYLKKHLWGDYFSKMLNIKDIDSLPDLQFTIDLMEDEIARMDSELQTQIRALSNILYRR